AVVFLMLGCLHTPVLIGAADAADLAILGCHAVQMGATCTFQTILLSVLLDRTRAARPQRGMTGGGFRDVVHELFIDVLVGAIQLFFARVLCVLQAEVFPIGLAVVQECVNNAAVRFLL